MYESLKLFFLIKLKETGWYETDEEIATDINRTIETIKYDQKNGDSIGAALNKACSDLYITIDGIEKFLAI